jgi:hypothetical protein
VNGDLQPPARDRIFREARAQFLRALSLRPRSLIFLVALARLESARGQTLDKQHFITAGELWRRAISYDPHNYRWHYQYSEMLGAAAKADNNNRQLRRAQIDEIQTSIGIYRAQPEAWRALEQAYRAIGDNGRADATRTAFFGAGAPNPDVAGTDPTEPSPARATSAPRAAGLAISVLGLLALGLAAFQHTVLQSERRQRAQKKKSAVAPDHIHELLIAAGLASIAMALPLAGLLFGVGLSDGDLREIVLHVVPGAAALWLGVLNSSRPYVGYRNVGALEDNLRAAALATSLIAMGIHLFDLVSGDGVSRAAGILFHEAPLVAIFMLVSTTQWRSPTPARTSHRRR